MVQELDEKKSEVDSVISSLSKRELMELIAMGEGYESVPVDIETFINDKYYLGQIYGMGEDGNPRVYPYWLNALKELFPTPLTSPYHEVCVSGCIGAGKTTVSTIGILYDLYRVTLIKNPHLKWHLIPTTQIVFTLVTATLDLAGVVLANQIVDALAASPYFCSKFNPGKGDKLDEDMFPNHVSIGFGSRGSHNLGKAVIGAIIDEANFQGAVGNQALDNYNTITRRITSRFMTTGGEVPCRAWIVSSRNEDSSFLEQHIEAERGNPKVKIFEPAIWEVLPPWKITYSGKTFPVFIGSSSEQPMIIATPEEEERCAGRVIQVPIEYRKAFEDNLPGALQDLAGVAIRNGINLIYNVEALNKSMCNTNWMLRDEIQLTLTGADQVIDYVDRSLIVKGSYYCHFDGALKGDRFGVAFSRVSAQIRVKALSSIDGTEMQKLTPHVDTPLCFGVKACPGSEIPLFKLRQFLVDMRSLGVQFKQISCDGFQSADMMQMLTKLGFTSKYVSVDKTKDPYLMIASNIVNGTATMPKSDILWTEFVNLQNQAKKVDHPDTITVNGKKLKGSKDLADAVTASQYEAAHACMTVTESAVASGWGKTPQHMNEKQKQEYVMKYMGLKK